MRGHSRFTHGGHVNGDGEWHVVGGDVVVFHMLEVVTKDLDL